MTDTITVVDENTENEVTVDLDLYRDLESIEEDFWDLVEGKEDCTDEVDLTVVYADGPIAPLAFDAVNDTFDFGLYETIDGLRNHYGEDPVLAFAKHIGVDYIDEFEDQYIGEANTAQQAMDLLDSDRVPDDLRAYVDWDALLDSYGITWEDGFLFAN